MNDIQSRLLNVLSEAARKYGSYHFVHESAFDGQTISFNGQWIHMDFDIYFGFGETDFDQLVSEGYLEYISHEGDQFQTNTHYLLIANNSRVIPNEGSGG